MLEQKHIDFLKFNFASEDWADIRSAIVEGKMSIRQAIQMTIDTYRDGINTEECTQDMQLLEDNMQEAETYVAGILGMC